jgi:5-(carboxyamino)imidazole ribonucleotide synthase
MKIGILGGGQLGRMLALAGYPLGLHFRVYEPQPDCPADEMAAHVSAAFDDTAALVNFSAGLDLLTYEFENVPVSCVEALVGRLPIFPAPKALATAQDRLHEKQLFQRLGIGIPPFAAVDSQAGLEAAVKAVGLPSVLKTRRLGYDGKGQKVLRSPADVAGAFESLGSLPCILEAFVAFEAEASMLAVRGTTGETRFYPIVENEHKNGILHISRVPARPAVRALQAAAERHAAAILADLDYVGVLAVEFFVAGGQLLANEMAPRVHNSGHWTQDGAVTSQFENHLRAGLGLPLGDTAAPRPAAMVNLVGALPSAAALLGIAGAKLHLYDKSPRAGRKLGHVNLTAESEQSLTERIAEVTALLPAAT